MSEESWGSMHKKDAAKYFLEKFPRELKKKEAKCRHKKREEKSFIAVYVCHSLPSQFSSSKELHLFSNANIKRIFKARDGNFWNHFEKKNTRRNLKISFNQVLIWQKWNKIKTYTRNLQSFNFLGFEPLSFLKNFFN